MSVNQFGRRQPSRRSPCFEPTDPPARPIVGSHLRRRAGSRWRSMGTGGLHAHPRRALTAIAPRRRRLVSRAAVVCVFPLPDRPQSRPHAGKDLIQGRIPHDSPSLSPPAGRHGSGRDPRRHSARQPCARPGPLPAIPRDTRGWHRTKTPPPAAPAEQTAIEASSPPAATIELVTTAEPATTAEAASTTATNSEPAAAVASTVAAEPAPVV